MEGKTVACIMPFYNYKDYLEEALESVFGQTRVPDEVILVDDCSTEDISLILSRYPAVQYVRHDVNRGLSAARNTGIRLAKSEYVFSFDSDDILRPRAVEEHLKLAGPDRIVTLPLMAFGGESYTAYPKPATIETLLKTNTIYSNSIFPKKAWEDIGGFDESDVMRKGWEDREFWLRCLGAGYKSVTGEYVALLWRRHGRTMSDNSANPNASLLQEYIYEKNRHLLA